MIERRTAILAGVAALAVLAAAYWLFSPRPIPVETAMVTEERFTVFVEEDGRTRVRDRYVVSSPLAGRVPRTTLRVGDAVKAGQLLATVTPNVSPLIDPRARRELEERVGAADAAVEEAAALQERAQVQLSRARTDLERTTQLKSRGVASLAQFDRDTYALNAAERDLAAADRRRHAAEHALDEARAALKRSGESETAESFPVTSPVEGRVLKIVQESEGVVGLGAPLIEVGDTGDLEVIVDLLTSDAAQVRDGAKVQMERSGVPAILEGRVRRVEPSGFTKVSALGVEEQRVWVVVDITSPRSQWTGLGDGYRIAARILIDEIENATVIPTGALFRRGEDWHVFVVESGRAQLCKIELRRRSGRSVAVANGLRSGQEVVLYPPSTLSPGARVSAMRGTP
jgi:HlyD family secretion protein